MANGPSYTICITGIIDLFTVSTAYAEPVNLLTPPHWPAKVSESHVIHGMRRHWPHWGTTALTNRQLRAVAATVDRSFMSKEGKALSTDSHPVPFYLIALLRTLSDLVIFVLIRRERRQGRETGTAGPRRCASSGPSPQYHRQCCLPEQEQCFRILTARELLSRTNRTLLWSHSDPPKNLPFR